MQKELEFLNISRSKFMFIDRIYADMLMEWHSVPEKSFHLFTKLKKKKKNKCYRALIAQFKLNKLYTVSFGYPMLRVYLFCQGSENRKVR